MSKTGKPKGVHCQHDSKIFIGEAAEFGSGGERHILAPSALLIHRGGKKYRLTPASVKGCNAGFYLSALREKDETHISTIRDSKKADPWLSGSHENHRRSGCYPGSSCQGTGSPRSVGLIILKTNFLRNCIIRFPKSHRLHQSEEFSSVIRFRCSARSEFLQVFAKPNNLVHSRLGLIVAGKIERLAVNRNRVKRLLREAFRARQQDLAGLDLVVRLRCRVAQSNSMQMTGEAEMLMIQLQRCRG